MPSEALRRLREDISAAWEAQQRMKTKKRAILPISTTCTSKYAKVTMLLASVGDPVFQTATSRRVSGRWQRYNGTKPPQWTKNEIYRLLHRIMVEWRAKAAGVEQRIPRARRWREQRVLNQVFTAWRRKKRHISMLFMAAAMAEMELTPSIELHVLWRRAQRLAATTRDDVDGKRRANPCKQVFKARVQRSLEGRTLTLSKPKGARQPIRRYWNWFKAAIATQKRMVQCHAEYFQKQRIITLKVGCFQRWIEGIEQQKLWRVAAQWSEPQRVGSAFDKWHDLMDDTKRMQRAFQTWRHGCRRDRRVRLCISHQRSVMLQTFELKRRVERLRKCWMAFAFLVQKQIRWRHLIATLGDTRKQRLIQLVLDAWQTRVRLLQEKNETVATHWAFLKRKRLEKAFKRWQNATTRKQMEATAVNLPIRHHEAKRAIQSRREVGQQCARVRQHSRQRHLQTCFGQWKAIVYNRHRKLWSEWSRPWKVAMDRQHRVEEWHRVQQLRWRWQRWTLWIWQCRALRAKAINARKRHEKRLISGLFVLVWFCKSQKYVLGAVTVATIAKQHGISSSLAHWRQHQQWAKVAIGAYDSNGHRLQQIRSLQLLVAHTLGFERMAVAYDRHQRLFRSLSGWKAYFTMQMQRRKADICFCRRRMQQVVHVLLLNARSSIASRKQRLEAKAWDEAVLIQTIWSQWYANVQQMILCRSVIVWQGMGHGACCEDWMETLKVLKAANFYSLKVLARTWLAIVRNTMRRQVRIIRWRYPMTSVFRLQVVYIYWKQLVKLQRGQSAVAATMYRMQEQRIVQQVLSAWKQRSTSCKTGKSPIVAGIRGPCAGLRVNGSAFGNQKH